MGPQFDYFLISSERGFQVAFGMGVLSSFKELHRIAFAIGVVNGLSHGRSGACRNQCENDYGEKKLARALKNHLWLRLGPGRLSRRLSGLLDFDVSTRLCVASKT